MSEDCSKVPSFIPGKVIGKIGFDVCQDGARFIFAPSGPHVAHLRVKPTNGEADKALQEALDSGSEVVIGGYSCKGTEPGCARFDCFVVTPATDFAAKAASL